MLSFEEMTVRFLVALALGALMGFERETAGKEAGVRTLMLVSGGAAIFSILSIVLPFLIVPAGDSGIAVATDFSRVISNIVVGVGFLGAGIIIKTEEKVRGLTTAALVWTSASVGCLVGVGLVWFAVVVAVVITLMLYFLRTVDLSRVVHQENEHDRK
jgi:putative Mg2+ transporter-C (MgtC) family protein